MSSLQILASQDIGALGVSLYVAIFVFVIVIIPLLITFAYIYNRRADRAEQRAAAAEQAELSELIELGRQVKLAQHEALANEIEELPETERDA